MSDTPETDYCIIERRRIHNLNGFVALELVNANLARKLERERDEARDVVKILCDEKPERPIYFQADIDEWMERHALAVQECEKLRRELDAAIRERDELRVYLDSAHYAACNAELRKELSVVRKRCADLEKAMSYSSRITLLAKFLKVLDERNELKEQIAAMNRRLREP